MRKRYIQHIYILLGVLLLLQPVLLFSNGSSDYEGVLRIGVGARPTALGGAFTSLSDDLSSIYYNPAGLAHSEGISLAFHQNFWLSDINIQFIAGQYDLGKYGHLGSALNIMTMGDIQGYDIFGEPTEEFTANSYILYLTYAKDIINNLLIGGNIKYIHDKIETSSGSTVSADLGFLTTDIPIEHLNLGLSFSNLFGKMRFEDTEEKLPLTYRFGISYSPLHLTNFTSTASFDLEKVRNQDLIYHYGLENFFYNTFALRAGYKHSNTHIIDRFSFGSGFAHKFDDFSLSLDFAYSLVSEETLGDTSQLSLEINL